MPTFTENPTELEVATGSSRAIASTVGVESRSVFGTRRSDKTPPKLSEAEELAELKKLLRAQGVARQREQENIIEVQRQLTSLETETSRVRGDLKCVQEQLADAKVEHTGALRRATEREAGLRNELEGARKGFRIQ